MKFYLSIILDWQNFFHWYILQSCKLKRPHIQLRPHHLWTYTSNLTTVVNSVLIYDKWDDFNPETAWSMAELSTIISVCFLLFRQHLLSFRIVFFLFFMFAFVWDLVLIHYVSWVASCCQKKGFIWIISCLWKTTGNNQIIQSIHIICKTLFSEWY
jgi:hypothetical protein